MPVYFVRSQQINQRKIEIRDSLAHHLSNVLRLREGEVISLVDEQPKRYTAKIIKRAPARLTLEILKEEPAPAEKGPMIHLGIGLLKGDKMDWTLQKATELGVSWISPLVTTRTVTRPKPERSAHHHERWMKIAMEAAQQSGRWDIPQIDLPSDLHHFLAEGTLDGFKFIFWEGAPPQPLKSMVKPVLEASPPRGTLLIGPEGGWEESEIEEAIQNGYVVLSLGRRILRSETAAIAALSILQYELEGKQKVVLSNGDH